MHVDVKGKTSKSYWRRAKVNLLSLALKDALGKFDRSLVDSVKLLTDLTENRTYEKVIDMLQRVRKKLMMQKSWTGHGQMQVNLRKCHNTSEDWKQDHW